MVFTPVLIMQLQRYSPDMLAFSMVQWLTILLIAHAIGVQFLAGKRCMYLPQPYKFYVKLHKVVFLRTQGVER